MRVSSLKGFMNDLGEKLKTIDFLKHLSEKNLEILAMNAKIIHIKSKEILFEENRSITDLSIVLYGSFKISKKNSEGLPVVLNFLGRGEFLGIALAGLNHPFYPATATAQEDCALLQFSREFFLSTLLRIETIRQAVNRQIGERFLELQNDRCMENARIHQRLADLLLRLWERHGEQMRPLPFPFTRQDIAQRIGAKPETVIRILSLWSKNGLIKTENKRIELLAPDKLKDLRKEKFAHCYTS